jgi:hypothetical protein
MRDAEPARLAVELFRGIAGDPPTTARRAVATIVIAAVAVASIPLLLAAFLAFVTVIGLLGAEMAPQDDPKLAVNWVAVAITTAVMVGIALAVSWTMHGRAARDPVETAGADPGPGREQDRDPGPRVATADRGQHPPDG